MARLLYLFVLSTLIIKSQPRLLLSSDDEYLTFFIPNVTVVTKDQLNSVLSLARVLQDVASKDQNDRAVAAAIAAAVGMLPPIEVTQAVRIVKSLPAEAQVHVPIAVELVAKIRSLGTAASCQARHAGHGPPGTGRILIASNLINCEEVMPYWILEVLRLALLLRADPVLEALYSSSSSSSEEAGSGPIKLSREAGPGRAAISVYESGSTDQTPVWLQVAQALWTAAGVPNTVVVDGSLTRHMDLMDPSTGKVLKQHRIQHLASLRNAALAPLYAAPGSFEHVLFVNDVFFCAPDLLRLAHLQADIACGIDVEIWVGGHVPKVKDAAPRNRGRMLRRRLAQAAMLAAGGALGGAAAGAAGSAKQAAPAGSYQAHWESALQLMTEVHADETAKQAEADARVAQARIKPRYEFYDIWVARDIGGKAFIKHDPIARDLRTVDSLHGGLPFAAKCCWNGAVLLNASHLSEGVRFRSGLRGDGECDASECSLFCEDYRRLGSGRVAIDPSVRVAYTPWTQDIHGALPGGIPGKVSWPEVRRRGAVEALQRMWADTANDSYVECVPLRKGFDGADLDRVRRVDVRAENFTATYLARAAAPSPPGQRACNLIMGPYGAEAEGDVWDDLPFAGWGKNGIARLSHTASEFLDSLQVVYGRTAARLHGTPPGDGGPEPQEHSVEEGEFINDAVVYYDERAVHGVALTTSVGRRMNIGNLRDGVQRAHAAPCPADTAQAGRYRLLAFAGTADRYVRSLTFIWT